MVRLAINLCSLLILCASAQQSYPPGLHPDRKPIHKPKYPEDQLHNERPRRENIYAKEHKQTQYEENKQVYDETHQGAAHPYKIPAHEDDGELLNPIRRVEDTKVECHKNHMIVKFKFSAPFNGYIYPYNHFPNCILFYGRQSHEAEIVLYHGACGKKLIENQNDPHFSPIIEHRLMIQWEQFFMCEDDSSVIVRCDKPDDFNKTVAWNFGTLNFDSSIERSTHPGPKMWMELQRGEGPGAPPIDDKAIFIGDVLTMVFTLSDDVFWFDSNILSCSAVDAGGDADRIEWEGDQSTQKALGYTGQMAVIENGCSVKPKLFSHFFKDKVTKNGHLITVHYAHFKAFRFPTSLKVIIRCDVEVCYKECDTLPSCRTGFQPRAADAAKQRKRRDVSQPESELETVELFRTIEVYPLDGSSNKDVPLLSSSPEKFIIREESKTCFSQATFYAWIGGLCFVICCLFAILFYTNTKDMSTKIFASNN